MFLFCYERGGMMKLRFNEVCRDKYTNELYEFDSIYEFEEERALEIIASGKAELVHSISEVQNAVEQAMQEQLKEDEKKKQEESRMINMFSLSKKELIELAKEVDVSIRGTKEEIIERILEKEVDNKAD